MSEYVHCRIPRDIAEALTAEREIYAVKLVWLDEDHVELVATRDLDLATAPESQS